jgi:TonB family protein
VRPHDCILTLVLLGSVTIAFTPAAAQLSTLPESALDVPSGLDPTFVPPPPAPPQGFTPPAAFTDTVQSEGDYPPESFRLGEQGIVRSRFLLTETGDATECTIESTSGYQRLDEAACGLVHRWKYKPNMDGGRAIASFVTVNHVFFIPPPRPPVVGDPSLNVPGLDTAPRTASNISAGSPLAERFTPLEPANNHAVTVNDYPADSIRMQEQGTIGLVLIVNETGDVSECVVWSSSGFPRLDAAARAMVVNRWKYKPAILDGKPTAILRNIDVVYQLR